MKKTALLALAVAPLVFSACAGEDRVIIVRETIPEDTVAEVTTTTEKFLQPTTTVTYFNPEDVFLSAVLNETTLGIYYTETQILSFGYLVCQHYSNGGTSDELVESIYNAGVANNATDDVMLAFAEASGIALRELCD